MLNESGLCSDNVLAHWMHRWIRRREAPGCNDYARLSKVKFRGDNENVKVCGLQEIFANAP